MDCLASSSYTKISCCDALKTNMSVDPKSADHLGKTKAKLGLRKVSSANCLSSQVQDTNLLGVFRLHRCNSVRSVLSSQSAKLLGKH